MNEKERFNDMEKALRAHCPVEELLDELPFDLYAANMVIHGYGNIEQALTEFADYLDCEIIEHSHEFTEQSYDAARRILKNTLHEFLNSLNNKNQGDN